MALAAWASRVKLERAAVEWRTAPDPWHADQAVRRFTRALDEMAWPDVAGAMRCWPHVPVDATGLRWSVLDSGDAPARVDVFAVLCERQWVKLDVVAAWMTTRFAFASTYPRVMAFLFRAWNPLQPTENMPPCCDVIGASVLEAQTRRVVLKHLGPALHRHLPPSLADVALQYSIPHLVFDWDGLLAAADAAT